MSIYDDDAECFLTINPDNLIDMMWKVKDLRKVCKSIGLRSNGTREDLHARIVAWHKGRKSLVDHGDGILNLDSKNMNLHLLPLGIIGIQQCKTKVKALAKIDSNKLFNDNDLSFPTPVGKFKDDEEELSPFKISPTLLHPLQSSLNLESAIKEKKTQMNIINDENVRPEQGSTTPIRKDSKSSSAMTSPPKSILKSKKKQVLRFTDIKSSHHLTFSPFNSVRMIPHRSTFANDELYKSQWGWPFFNYNPPDPLEELEYENDDSNANYYDCIGQPDDNDNQDDDEDEYEEAQSSDAIVYNKRIRCSLDRIMSVQDVNQVEQEVEQEEEEEEQQVAHQPQLQGGVSLFPTDEDDVNELLGNLGISPSSKQKSSSQWQAAPHRYNTRSKAKVARS